MLATLIASGVQPSTSQGDSGIGPVVIVVGLTIASALVLTWIVNRLPDWGKGSRLDPANWRRRADPGTGIPDDRDGRDDRPPSGPFER